MMFLIVEQLKAYVDGNLVCEAEMMARVVDR